MAYLGKQIRKNIVITLTGLSMTGSQVYALPRLPNGRCQPSRSLCLRQERRGRDNNNYPSAYLGSHPDTNGRRVCRATSGLDNTRWYRMPQGGAELEPGEDAEPIWRELRLVLEAAVCKWMVADVEVSAFWSEPL